MPVAALPVTQQMTEMSISTEDKVTPKTEMEPGVFCRVTLGTTGDLIEANGLFTFKVGISCYGDGLEGLLR